MELLFFIMSGLAVVSLVIGVLKNREIRKLENEVIYERRIKETYDAALSIVRTAVYYHPETDTFIPFEDLKYVGDF